jgi:branched-chain amino acid transport system ATP-binding protein
VRIHFEGIKAVNGVDLELRAGEILGLIGPNGAGKTTLMNALSGFVPLTGGRTWLGSHETTGWPPRRLARSGIARTFQNLKLFRELSVFENVEVAAVGVGMSRKQARARAREMLSLFGLESRQTLRANRLSYGEEQRVALARALATRPRFLLLDEPAAGLNEVEGDELIKRIASVRETEHCGVLLIEHDMRLVMDVCDRVQVLENGCTLSEGDPVQVQQDPRVVRAYLGSKRAARRARRVDGETEAS